MNFIVKFKALCLVAFIFVFCNSNGKDLNVGDKVTPFSAVAENGKKWDAKKVIGKNNLVVFFYPGALTGGCTKQACAYRDDLPMLDSLDAMVVGISGDPVKNLQLFKEANDLNFTLLSDPDGEIAGLFGVPNNKEERSLEKVVNGITYQLVRESTSARWTFIIDKEGKVVYKSTQVDAAEDSKTVMDILKAL